MIIKFLKCSVFVVAAIPFVNSARAELSINPYPLQPAVQEPAPAEVEEEGLTPLQPVAEPQPELRLVPVPEPKTMLLPVSPPAAPRFSAPLPSEEPPVPKTTVKNLATMVVPANAPPRAMEVLQMPVTPAARSYQTYRGSDLREVLGVWSKSAGVEMIWNASSGFYVPQTEEISGNYEEAVTRLLEQYGQSAGRPVGRLHVDSASGQKTLVISTDQEG